MVSRRMSKVPKTRGWQLLCALLETMDQEQLQKRTGVPQPTISQLKQRRRMPGRVSMQRLEAAGIPMPSWGQPPIRAVAAPTLADARMAEDSEPTNPEVPAAKRQSSAPALPVDFENGDEDTDVDRQPLPAVLPATQRDRVDTDPDPNAGEELPPIPKRLTVYDDDERTSTPEPDGAF